MKVFRSKPPFETRKMFHLQVAKFFFGSDQAAGGDRAVVVVVVVRGAVVVSGGGGAEANPSQIDKLRRDAPTLPKFQFVGS